MILIDALFINTGGAKVVLETIIYRLKKEGKLHDFFFLLDDRLAPDFYNLFDNKNYFILNANLFARRKYYLRNIKFFSKIICLANLPPPIEIKEKPIFILFHNAHILKPSLKSYQIWSITKYRLKWLYILLHNRNYYRWVVQTKSMHRLLNDFLFVDEKQISIIPFFGDNLKSVYHKIKKFEKNSDNICFAYIADGQIQKNHEYLLNVWEHLYKGQNKNLKLILTVSDAYPELINRILILKEKGLNIVNLGIVNHEKILNLYQSIDYLIYPSLIESFGLPLIEAAMMKCNIIAVNKEYVFDVIEPSVTFSESKESDLVNIILNICNGFKYPETKIVIGNQMNQLIELFN